MPRTRIQVEPDVFTKNADRLLREYTQKMAEWTEKAHQISTPSRDADLSQKERQKRHQRALVEWRDLQDLANRLRGPMQELSQQVSQMVEHGALDDLSRIELRLRLAEFENSMNRLGHVWTYQPEMSAG